MMKVLKAYTGAWGTILKYRFPILFLFLANIVFTFIVTSPFTIYFKSKFVNSDALEKYEGFDIDALMEFLNNYGQGLEPLNTLFLLFLMAFFIFGVYTNAAVLYAVISKNKVVALRSFWNGGLSYFWRILRLSLYYILTVGVILFVTWKLLLAVGINVLQVENDDEIVTKIRIGLIVALALIAIVSTIKEYAKVFIAIEQKPFISASIAKSTSFTFNRIVNTLGLYFLNIAIIVVVFLFYVLVRNSFSVNSWVILFVLAQVLLIFKIIARIVHLDSTYKLYRTLKN